MIVETLRTSAFKAMVIGMSVVGLGVLISSPAHADASDRMPGSFACLNNPDPACGNPERDIAGTDFSCMHNLGPACTNEDRYDLPLRPGSFVCSGNQNVNCSNPVRYSVKEPEMWPSYFGAGE